MKFWIDTNVGSEEYLYIFMEKNGEVVDELMGGVVRPKGREGLQEVTVTTYAAIAWTKEDANLARSWVDYETAVLKLLRWESILRYMQRQDPNGDWLKAPFEAEEIRNVLETLNEWTRDGLDATRYVFRMCEWLGEQI